MASSACENASSDSARSSARFSSPSASSVCTLNSAARPVQACTDSASSQSTDEYIFSACASFTPARHCVALGLDRRRDVVRQVARHRHVRLVQLARVLERLGRVCVPSFARVGAREVRPHVRLPQVHIDGALEEDRGRGVLLVPQEQHPVVAERLDMRRVAQNDGLQVRCGLVQLVLAHAAQPEVAHRVVVLVEVGQDRLQHGLGALEFLERHVEQPDVVPDVRLHVVHLGRLDKARLYFHGVFLLRSLRRLAFVPVRFAGSFLRCFVSLLLHRVLLIHAALRVERYHSAPQERNMSSRTVRCLRATHGSGVHLASSAAKRFSATCPRVERALRSRSRARPTASLALPYI